MGKQQPPWSKPWQIDDSARHEASAAAILKSLGAHPQITISYDNFCFLKDMLCWHFPQDIWLELCLHSLVLSLFCKFQKFSLLGISICTAG